MLGARGFFSWEKQMFLVDFSLIPEIFAHIQKPTKYYVQKTNRSPVLNKLFIFVFFFNQFDNKFRSSFKKHHFKCKLNVFISNVNSDKSKATLWYKLLFQMFLLHFFLLLIFVFLPLMFSCVKTFKIKSILRS